jgi:hypothetical protein
VGIQKNVPGAENETEQFRMSGDEDDGKPPISVLIKVALAANQYRFQSPYSQAEFGGSGTISTEVIAVEGIA